MELPPGETIYFGTVHPLGSAAVAYVYERRVEDGDEIRSTHITRDPAGDAVFVESAAHDADYRLLSDQLLLDQAGTVGRIDVLGSEVTLTCGDRTRTERLTDPVVVGPTLVGFLVRHLPELRDGAEVGVRVGAIERVRTYAFTAEVVGDRVRLRPDALVVRAAVGSIWFTFDGDRIVALEGRVPPKAPDGGPLDAHVDYRFVAPAYR